MKSEMLWIEWAIKPRKARRRSWLLLWISSPFSLVHITPLWPYPAHHNTTFFLKEEISDFQMSRFALGVVWVDLRGRIIACRSASGSHNPVSPAPEDILLELDYRSLRINTLPVNILLEKKIQILKILSEKK